MDAYLNKRESELQAELAKIVQIRAIQKKYPDLARHVNRWHVERFTSSNIVATDCEIKHNCGCCNDSPVEVWPYAEVDGFRVYVKGIPFVVGQKNPYDFGEIADPGWEEKLTKAGLCQDILNKVRAYLGTEEQ